MSKLKPFWPAIVLIGAFAIHFWLLQVMQNPNEPLYLTSLYRYWDYTHFNVITRLFSHPFGELFFIDSLGQGPLPYPVVGLLPYSLLTAVFSGFGFVLGDVLAHGLRFVAFYLLMRSLAASRTDRLWLSILMFFLSSEFVLGDHQGTSLMEGVWGIRIPRPIVTSVFFILSLVSLERLLTELKGELKVWRLLLLALPLGLVANGDVYCLVALCVLYAAVLGWLVARGEADVLPTLVFAVLAGAAIAPSVLYMTSFPSELVSRLGQFPVRDHLATIEIPLRAQLFVIAGAGALMVASFRRFGGRSGWPLMAMAFLLIIAGLMASILVGSLRGANIQEYHFASLRNRYVGLWFCLFVIYGLQRLKEAWPKFGQMAQIAVTAVVIIMAFSANHRYASEYADKTSAPEPGLGAEGTNGWRTSAARLAESIQSRRPLVVASLDTQLNVLLSMYDDVYLYINPPYKTPATEEELAFRFLYICALLDMPEAMVDQLVSNKDIHVSFLTHGKYQFNRLHTYARLSAYPTEVVDGASILRDNWGLFVPPQEAERLKQMYKEVRMGLSVNPNYSRFRVPDLIVLPNVGPLAGLSPKGYRETQRDAIFRVFER